MAKKHMVTCRTCKIKFDAQPEDKDIVWTMPSTNWYYHKECYENWKASSNHVDEEWVSRIYDFISRDLKVPYNWNMIEAQRKKFIKQRMTNKGIYFALYWYFMIKNHKWKSDFGIGIVPHIYEQSTNFWIDKANKNDAIYKQVEQFNIDREQKAKEITKKTRRRKKIKAPEEL